MGLSVCEGARRPWKRERVCGNGKLEERGEGVGHRCEEGVGPEGEGQPSSAPRDARRASLPLFPTCAFSRKIFEIEFFLYLKY